MLVALLSSNALCLLLHIWLSAPSAGEVTRGYLHGGLAMDFIGQAGPTNKLYLVLLDLLIVFLQLTHMAAFMVQSRLKEASAPPTVNAIEAEAIERQQPPPRPGQDLDAEERGVIRSEEQQDIEMQTLNPPGTAAATSADPSSTAESSEREALLAPEAPRTDAYIFDAFHSGQIVIADLDLRRRIHDQVQLIKNYRVDSQASSSQILRFELANRMLRMRMGADALRETI
jgi:hypothetical protein